MATPPDSLPSSFDQNPEQNERAMGKVFRRLQKEPLIPLGVVLTVAAFVNSARAVRRGDRLGAQRMFRARVLAQGFTILAMAAGGSYFNEERKKKKELEKIKAEEDAEERRQLWIRELEMRDEEDTAAKEELARRRERRKARSQAAGEQSNEKANPQTKDAIAETKSSGGGGWFGWVWGSGGKKPIVLVDAEKPSAAIAPKQPEKTVDPNK